MSQIEVPSDILALPIADRIELVGMIWDSIEDSSEIELTDQQRQILKERLAAHRADPASGVSWEELREEIRRRDIEFEQNPNNGEFWENVEQEIFGS